MVGRTRAFQLQNRSGHWSWVLAQEGDEELYKRTVQLLSPQSVLYQMKKGGGGNLKLEDGVERGWSVESRKWGQLSDLRGLGGTQSNRVRGES